MVKSVRSDNLHLLAPHRRLPGAGQTNIPIGWPEANLEPVRIQYLQTGPSPQTPRAFVPLAEGWSA